MNGWELYESRMNIKGVTKRQEHLNRERRYQEKKIRESLSYHQVEIDDEARDVAIIDTDNLNTKFIFSMPGEDIRCGGLVSWADNHWLITERDANTEVYTRAKMIQCNYLLRWVDKDKEIHEQWCIIEDGTKYLTGEYEDHDIIVTRGDSRISMTIARNEHTVKFDRTCRFLIDDPESSHMIAYGLTKPLKLGGVFNGDGVYKFVLQEINTTDLDNQELRIADYYKYFPGETPTVEPPPEGDGVGRKVWL